MVASDFAQLERSWYVFFFQAEALSDLIVGVDDFAFLEHLWRRWSPGWSPDTVALDAMRCAFARPGVKRAALAYYRTSFNAGHRRAAESAALGAIPLQTPVLALSGAQDGCIPPDVFEASMPEALFAAGRTLERWTDAGHFLHLEHLDRVARRIEQWLSGERPAAR